MAIRGSKPGSTKETLNKALSQVHDEYVKAVNGNQNPALDFGKAEIKRLETREKDLTPAESIQLTHLRAYVDSVPQDEKVNVALMMVTGGYKAIRYFCEQDDVKLEGLEEAFESLKSAVA